MRTTPSPGTLTLPGMEDVGLSPIRRQYLELKRKVPIEELYTNDLLPERK